MPNIFKKFHLEMDFRNTMSAAPVYENRTDYQVTGEKKFTVRRGMPWPRKLANGTYAYCVTPEGEVRFSTKPRPDSDISHPELVKGKGVIAAGMLCIAGNQVTEISCESGHYMPGADSIFYAIVALRHWGAPLDESMKQDSRWEHFG